MKLCLDWFLRILGQEAVERGEQVVCVMFWEILKKSISFCLFLHWDKEWILWVESRDAYEEDQDLEATFNAKCWTASMENETEGEDGSQIEHPYSRIGRTMVL